MEENGRLVQFLYNEDREVVAEKDYSGNLIRYIRGLGLISSDSENAKTYYHYVCDEQGSVSHIIRGEDKESGVSEQGREQDRILNQYEYDAFGNTISCKEQVENRFRYQGEQYDPITRQYYLRARYYNPVIGRFIQEDTYYGDGLNLYEYCRNNTITYKDPTGHNICPTQRDLYHKYKEEGMSPQEAYQKMRKELGLDSKSGYKDSGVGNGKDPWRSYESGSSSYSLLPSEGEIGTYRELLDAGEVGDNITPHHMPSAEYMSQYGVGREDGLCMNMEMPSPGTGGRHRLTDTYGRNMTDAEKAYYYSLSPRDALAYDIANMRQIYQSQGLYSEIRPKLQEYIKKYMELMPELFDK